MSLVRTLFEEYGDLPYVEALEELYSGSSRAKKFAETLSDSELKVLQARFFQVSKGEATPEIIALVLKAAEFMRDNPKPKPKPVEKPKRGRKNNERVER